MTLESLRIALRGILANRVRSSLTVLGILIGTAAVILLVALGIGISNDVQMQIRNLGTNTLYVLPKSNERAPRGGTDARRYRLTREDVRALSDKDRVPAVGLVAAAQATSGTLTWKGATHSLENFFGAEPNYLTIRNSSVKAGRLLNADDEASHAKVAVVGSTVVERLMGRGVNPVGQDIEFNHVRLRVVGLLSSKGSDGVEDQDDIVIIPLSAAIDHVVGTVDSFTMVMAQAVSRERLAEAQDQVTATLRQTHDLQPQMPPDFEVVNTGELAEAGEAAASQLQLLLGGIAVISLIVGGIGIMNIMLVTVHERTREIGIRMALGAQRSDVLTQFLAEAMLLAGLGGLCGVLLGVGLGQLPVGEAKPVVLPSTVIVSFSVSVLVGVFFGAYPARRAAGLKPIEALRFE